MMPGSPGAHPDPRVFIPVTAAGHPAPALRTFPVMSLPSLSEGLTYVLTTRSALVDLTPKLKYPTLVASTPGCAVRPGTTVYILFLSEANQDPRCSACSHGTTGPHAQDPA